MRKTVITAYVDSDAVEYHRAKGTNVSKIVSDYLVALMGDGVKDTGLEQKLVGLESDLAQARAQKMASEKIKENEAERLKSEQFRVDVLSAQDLNKRRKCSDPYAEKLYCELVQKMKVNYDLPLPVVMDYIEGKKFLS